MSIIKLREIETFMDSIFYAKYTKKIIYPSWKL